VHPDEAALGDIVEQTVSTPIRAELMTMLEQMVAYHPDELHPMTWL
jgi:hypothetical protein